MRSRLALPLPRFILHPLTALAIAAVHLYLAAGHLSKLFGGDVQWTHVWKGFGALAGAYVFAALASRQISTRPQHAPGSRPWRGASGWGRQFRDGSSVPVREA